MSGEEAVLDRRADGARAIAAGPAATAVVLTYRRPRLASQVVRGLLEKEGVPPSGVVLVVNGEGGLDDRALEASIRVLRLKRNVGPAGGFARAFRFVYESSDLPWIYACEDDLDLSALPSPRLVGLVERAAEFDRAVPGPPVGVVIASGWDIDARTGGTRRHVGRTDSAFGFEDAGFGAWDATLVSRRVLDAGVVPDESLFWWAEEADFCQRVRRAGFRVLVDVLASEHLRNAATSTLGSPQRDRPGRVDEPWCSYYMARNGFILRRRFGSPRWTLWHLRKSARRYQLAPSGAHRAAIVRGLMDGFLGRTGSHPRYVREVGEW
jgi:GT2 family glycosyltransferase